MQTQLDLLTTALGKDALGANTTGSVNVAIANSLTSNTTGESNVSVGSNSLV